MVDSFEHRFPVDLEGSGAIKREDGRLQLDNSSDLAAIADLVSDIYLEMKRSKRNQLAHVFGLAYLTLLEEMDKPRFDEPCN